VSGSSYVGNAKRNGVTGSLGRLNLKAGQTVNLEVSIVDAESGDRVKVDGLPMTFLDIDEGKRGKGRATVSVCGAEQFLPSPSELTLGVEDGGRCRTATSSVAGNSKDNPSSVEAALVSLVASKRVVSYVFNSDTDTYSVTLQVAKGYGYRNFLFSMLPGAACADDSNLPSQCAVALEAEE